MGPRKVCSMFGDCHGVPMEQCPRPDYEVHLYVCGRSECWEVSLNLHCAGVPPAAVPCPPNSAIGTDNHAVITATRGR